MTRKLWVMALGVMLVNSMLVTAAGPGRVQITGVITAIGDQQIVVDDVTVQVTPTTLITMRTTEIAFDDLALGMTVRVCGKMSDSVLVADRVNVMYNGN
jgi:hypothetical protein